MLIVYIIGSFAIIGGLGRYFLGAYRRRNNRSGHTLVYRPLAVITQVERSLFRKKES